MTVHVQERPSKDLARITFLDGLRRDTALWVTVRLHKPNKCIQCGRELAVGTRALRPITNRWYRMRRLCEGCVRL